jgi:hypothetical protein
VVSTQSTTRYTEDVFFFFFFFSCKLTPHMFETSATRPGQQAWLKRTLKKRLKRLHQPSNA